MMKLKQVMNPLKSDGLFKILYTLRPDSIWLNTENFDTLDRYYIFGHSGEKYISSLYRNLLELEQDESITSAIVEIAKIILQTYEENWNKIFLAYTQDYNPLENYSMIENERVKSKVITSAEGDNNVYGFNSISSVPTSKAQSKQITEGSKDDNDRDLTRSGNIGVTTSQQMLESEIKLRTYKFYEEVCKDIDKLLCLKSY